MKKILLAALALLLASPAYPQSTKLTLDNEINTNWPDNTSGAITPALLRSTVTDIVASYIDWLTCTAQGSTLYWGASGIPSCLAPGTSGQFLKTQGAAANPVWATPSLPPADILVAANQVVLGNRNGASQAAQELTTTTVLDFISSTAGQILQRGASIWSGTSTPILGASGTPGSVEMGNATSGTVKIQPIAGALTPSSVMSIPSLTANLTATIASGAKALATGAIASATCTTTQFDPATGTQTTDIIIPSFSGDPTGVTGYIPLTAGMLTIVYWPTVNQVNFKVCNNTGSSITPGAITLNWRVVR